MYGYACVYMRGWSYLMNCSRTGYMTERRWGRTGPKMERGVPLALEWRRIILSTWYRHWYEVIAKMRLDSLMWCYLSNRYQPSKSDCNHQSPYENLQHSIWLNLNLKNILNTHIHIHTYIHIVTLNLHTYARSTVMFRLVKFVVICMYVVDTGIPTYVIFKYLIKWKTQFVRNSNPTILSNFPGE